MTWPHTGSMDEFVLGCIASGRYIATGDGHIINTNFGGWGTSRLVAENVGAHGYLQCHLSDGNRRTSVSVHRVVCLGLLGPPPNDRVYEVNHVNGIKTDNRIVNLEWVTVSENCKHALRTHLREIAPHILAHGADSSGAKLSESEVGRIKDFAATGLSHTKIAPMFGVSRSTVSMLLRGVTWKDRCKQ